MKLLFSIIKVAFDSGETTSQLRVLPENDISENVNDFEVVEFNGFYRISDLPKLKAAIDKVLMEVNSVKGVE